MLGNLKTIFRCPYCFPNGGEIAVDIAGAFAWGESNLERDSVLLHEENPSWIVFDPDNPKSGPCDHLVSFFFDLGFGGRYTKHRKGSNSVAVDWVHAWFLEHDPQLFEFLLINASRGPASDYRGFLPRLAHKNFSIAKTIKVVDPSTKHCLWGHLQGGATTLLETEKFLAQLPACEKQLQAFWARESAENTSNE